MKKERQTNFWYCLALVILPVFFFGHLFFPHLKFFYPADFLLSDLIHVNLSQKYYLSQLLKQNQLPFISSETANGFPLLAESQIGALSPINILMYKFLPFALAFNLTYLLGFIIMNLSSYGLIKTLTRNSALSFFGAVSWMFAGIVMNEIVHQGVLQAIFFLPLIYWLIIQATNKQSITLFALAAFVSSQQFLFGHFFVSFATQLFVSIYMLFFLFLHRNLIKRFIIPLVLYALIFLFLISPQLIQSTIYTIESNRSIKQNLNFANGSFEKPFLLTFFTPFPFGGFAKGDFFKNGLWGNTSTIPWENSLFIGYAFPFLVTYLLIKKIKSNIRFKLSPSYFLLISLLVSFLLMFGSNSPTKIIYSLPFFNSFRFTCRFSLFTSFFLLLTILLFLNQIRINSRTWIGLSIIHIFAGFILYSQYFPTLPAERIMTKPSLASTIKKQTYYEFGSAINWLKTFKKYGYSAIDQYLIYHQGQYPYLNLLYNTNSANLFKYSNYNPSQYNEYVAELDINLGQDRFESKLSSKSKRLLNLLGVNLLVTPFKYDNLPIVAKSNYYLYQIKNSLPLYGLYSQTETIFSDSYFDYLLSTNKVRLNQVLYSQQLTNRQTKNSEYSVKKTNIRSNNLQFEVITNRHAYFFLRYLNFPGWEAKIDYSLVPIIKVQELYMAISIPPGNHQVSFIYRPKFWLQSIGLNFIGYLITLITLIFPKFFANINNQLYSQNKRRKN